jgi:anti-sigma factor RsiW
MSVTLADGHLSDGEMVQLMDGELAGPERERADAHLTACEVCGGRLRRLRGRSLRLGALLREADWEVPPAQAPDELSVRRARRAAAPAPRSWLRAAAVVLVLLGVVVVASPLRARVTDWLTDTWAQITGAETRPTASPAPPPGERTAGTRVRFVPVGGVFTVELDHPQREGTATLRLSGSDSATVEQVGGGAPVELLVVPSESRVRVRNRPGDTSDYRVRVPEGAREVRIRLGDRPAVTVSRARLADGERVPLGGS